MVGVLTFYQIFKQGLFSALIMAVLSIASAFAAINYYESLARVLNDAGLSNFGMEAVCLLLLFSACLLFLRLLSDRLIRGNMNFPLLIDRVGAGFFGLIGSLVIAGMVAWGFQLLPLDAKIMGFNRHPKLPQMEKESNLFPNADGFVVGLVRRASNYGFAGGNPFNRTHPDFLSELYMNRLALDPASRREAADGSVQIDQAWILKEGVSDCRSNEKLTAPRGEIYIVVRVQIKAGTGDEERGSRDVDNNIRLVMGGVRLVGYELEDQRGDGYARYPMGILKPGWRLVDRVGLDQGRMFTTTTGVLDLLFEWPSDIKTIPPDYIEFKRSARADMPSAKELAEAAPDRTKMFEASRTADKGDLQQPTDSKVGYICKSITVLGSGEQPTRTMNIPPDGAFEDAKEKKTYTELEPIKLISERYGEGHVMVTSALGRIGDDYKRLAVPRGYNLVLLDVDASQSAIKNNLILPRLTDIDNKEYKPVGFGAEGVLESNKTWEFFYTTDEQKIATGVDPRFALLEKDGQITKLTCYYLIKQGEQPTGLIGCRTRLRSDDAGELWALSGDIDVVLVKK
jgi:hypothetical protein